MLLSYYLGPWSDRTASPWDGVEHPDGGAGANSDPYPVADILRCRDQVVASITCMSHTDADQPSGTHCAAS